VKIVGEVVKIGEKKGKSNRGAWTLYSLKILQDDGTEADWISVGFDKPDVNEGDYVTVTAEENERGFLGAKPRDIIPTTRPPRSQAANKSVFQQSETVVSGTDRQTGIILQHSQEMAIAAMGLLLTNDALPMSEAKTKAGTAKRFDEIVASIDKFTVKYYNDVVSGRLLESVTDMGVVDTSADGPIPNVSPGNDEDDE
jgi:hypothetical protein